MQPRSHELVIRRALERIERTPPAGRLEALLSGNEAEDTYVWPVLGWRTPAIGLTHTYRPGRSRGELLLPSARTRCAALFEAARAAGDPIGAARLLGRACHLLTDTAVPARTRGVWHYLGDPLERWIEAHQAEAAEFADAEIPPERSPGALVDRLAARSAAFPADTTRTLSGLARRALGGGVRLGEAEIASQARVLVPLAVAHVAALLLAHGGAPD